MRGWRPSLEKWVGIECVIFEETLGPWWGWLSLAKPWTKISKFRHLDPAQLAWLQHLLSLSSESCVTEPSTERNEDKARAWHVIGAQEIFVK